MELAEVDLLNGDRWVDGSAEDQLTYLRNNAPVWRHPDPTGGPGVWMITKHEDVKMMSRTPEIFSADRDNGGINGMTKAELDQVLASQAGTGKMFLQMDPPEHGPYRKNLQPGLAPRVIHKFEQPIEEIAGKVFDRALAKGQFDFVEDVAVEIPLNLVAELIGVPEADRHWLFEHVTRTEQQRTPSSPAVFADPEDAKRRQVSIDAIRNYGEKLILRRLEDPQDDLATRLSVSEVDGQKIPLTNSVSNFFLLWGAAAETTRTALSWGMYAFMKFPDQWQKVREDPSLLDGPAVEEILRWSTPARRFRRNVMEDCEVRGQQLKKDDGVIMWYLSANRDEEVFENPFTFDVTRDPNPHLTFGGGGPHLCMGNHLARLELKMVFQEIIRRVPEPKLLAEPRLLKNNQFRAFHELLVDFT